MEVSVSRIKKSDNTFINLINHDEKGYHQLAECGTRILGNLLNYRFADCSDSQDVQHYIVMEFEKGLQMNARKFYQFELKDFYELIALLVSGNIMPLVEILNDISAGTSFRPGRKVEYYNGKDSAIWGKVVKTEGNTVDISLWQDEKQIMRGLPQKDVYPIFI